MIFVSKEYFLVLIFLDFMVTPSLLKNSVWIQWLPTATVFLPAFWSLLGLFFWHLLLGFILGFLRALSLLISSQAISTIPMASFTIKTRTPNKSPALVYANAYLPFPLGCLSDPLKLPKIIFMIFSPKFFSFSIVPFFENGSFAGQAA